MNTNNELYMFLFHYNLVKFKMDTKMDRVSFWLGFDLEQMLIRL